MAAAKPYSAEMTAVLAELAGSAGSLDHPLLVERARRPARRRAHRDQRPRCGGYNSNALRSARELIALLEEEGKQPVLVRHWTEGHRLLHLPWPVDRFVVEWLLAEADLRRRRSGRGSARRPVHGGIGSRSNSPTAAALAGVDEIHVVCYAFRRC